MKSFTQFTRQINEMAATPQEQAFLRSAIEGLLETEFVRKKGAVQAGKVQHPNAFRVEQAGKKIIYHFLDESGKPTDLAGGGKIPWVNIRQRIQNFITNLRPLVEKKFYMVAYNRCVTNDKGDNICYIPKLVTSDDSVKHYFYSKNEVKIDAAQGSKYRKAGYIQLLDVNDAAKIVLDFSRLGEFEWAKVPLV